MTPEEQQAFEDEARLASEQETEKRIDALKNEIQIAFLNGVRLGLESLRPK